MLTKSMAQELGPHGITVNTIAPGRYLLHVDAQVRGSKDMAPASRETLITISGP